MAKFKETVCCCSLPLCFTLAQVYYLVCGAIASTRATLNNVVPLKEEASVRKLAQFNSKLWALQETLRELQRKLHSTNLEETQSVWKCPIMEKEILCKARAAYYASLIEEDKNKSSCLFRAVARLSKSRSSVNPCIPLTFTSNDFMNFYKKIK